jgi:hypothetical protein
MKYYSTVKNLDTPYLPHDGLAWPKHAVNLHENLDYVLIGPIICQVTFEDSVAYIHQVVI